MFDHHATPCPICGSKPGWVSARPYRQACDDKMRYRRALYLACNGDAGKVRALLEAADDSGVDVPGEGQPGTAGVAAPVVPDDVWEALQRMIENAASLGPACQEDALIVARWRGQFVAARERAAAGVKEGDRG